MYLLARGRTQYEAYRWRDMKAELVHKARERAAGAAGGGRGLREKEQRRRGQEQGQEQEQRGQELGEGRQRGQERGGGQGGGSASSATEVPPEGCSGEPQVTQGGALGSSVSGSVCGPEACCPPHRRTPRIRVVLPPNRYNRGFLTNLSEVLFPAHHLRLAVKPKRS